MTTENKAKGYNDSVNEPIGFADAQDFFSEPKESEDERIRKNCIHFLELQKSHHASTFEIEECIAWLEKKDDYNEAHMQDVRERAAIAALSCTLSDPNTVGNFEQFAEAAVGYADALIERLKKKQA